MSKKKRKPKKNTQRPGKPKRVISAQQSARLKQAEATKAAAEREIAGLLGAQDGLDYVSRCWQGG